MNGATPREEPADASGSGGGTVLLAEDDIGIREAIASILRNEEYEVVTACDGQEALEVLRAGPAPALILLDLVMPIRSGWEVAAQLQADPSLSEIPVVVLSGVSDVHQQVGALGVDGYLRKPVDLDILLQVVKSYCR